MKKNTLLIIEIVTTVVALAACIYIRIYNPGANKLIVYIPAIIAIVSGYINRRNKLNK